MFDFKFRRYRKAVDTEMSYLVGFADDYLRKMLAAYPGTEVAIRDHCNKNTASMEVAAIVWTAILTDQIETSPELRGDAERIERYVFNGEGEPKWKIERMARTFLCQTDVQVTLGAVEEYTFTRAVSEILGALRGVPRNERAARRIVAPLLNRAAEA